MIASGSHQFTIPEVKQKYPKFGYSCHLVLSGFVIHFISIEDFFCPPGNDHISLTIAGTVASMIFFLFPFDGICHVSSLEGGSWSCSMFGGWTDARHWAFQLEVAFVHLPMDRNVEKVCFVASCYNWIASNNPNLVWTCENHNKCNIQNPNFISPRHLSHLEIGFEKRPLG